MPDYFLGRGSPCLKSQSFQKYFYQKANIICQNVHVSGIYFNIAYSIEKDN
jgi:hypothetical protein